MSSDQQIGAGVVVEVSLPNSGECDSSIDRQNGLPFLAIIVAALKPDAAIGPNHLRAPELDGRARVDGRAEVTNLVKIAKPGEGAPQGDRAETSKNEPNAARSAHRDRL
jgi:hypothetical protein